MTDLRCSCVLLFLGIDNTEKGPGPKSKHARERNSMEAGSDVESNEKAISEPEPAHVPTERTDEAPSAAPAAEYEPRHQSER